MEFWSQVNRMGGPLNDAWRPVIAAIIHAAATFDFIVKAKYLYINPNGFHLVSTGVQLIIIHVSISGDHI